MVICRLFILKCGYVYQFDELVILFYFQGFGMLLMEEVERIVREEYGFFKIVVILGVLGIVI